MAQTQAGLDSEINTVLISGSGITAAQLRQVLHDMNAGIFQTTITGLAPPTSLIGLTANPGVLQTAMASDATPALSQSIAPTWTGPHFFNNGTPSTNTSTGAITCAGGVGIAGALWIGQTINAGGSIYVGTANNPIEAAARTTGTVSGTVATTDISLSLPAGSTIRSVSTYTTTAFLASGSVNFTAGTVVGDNLYVAATTIKALGIVNMTLGSTAPALAALTSLPGTSPNFFIRLTQTGTPSGVGSAIIIVVYVLP
jgi:hypothetical protein